MERQRLVHLLINPKIFESFLQNMGGGLGGAVVITAGRM